jgi:hypothetical protein
LAGVMSLEVGDRIQESGAVYDIQGRRHSSLLTPRSSLYIRNGKKFLSK